MIGDKKEGTDQLLEKLGGKEVIEDPEGQYKTTDFPKPVKRYSLTIENYGMLMEEPYFWVVNHLRSMGLGEVIKIEDTFTASESSSFFGGTQQRLAAQQERLGGYLKVISDYIKELFQIVRELRLLDERMEFYKGAESNNAKLRYSSEVTLKSIWIDLVEGGAKNPGSVYGLAQQIGFTVLPELFYSYHPKKLEDIGRIVDPLQFNKSVKNVLKRKLEQYIAWRDATHKENQARRMFMLKKLKQHVDVTNLYIAWVRPYLRQIKRLAGDLKHLDSPEIVAAFENAMIEIEILAKKKVGEANAVIVAHFLYRVAPKEAYGDYGQKGWAHIGRLSMDLRTYAWTDKEIEEYKDLKKKQDIDMMATLSGTLEASLQVLGDDLDKYMKEATGEAKKSEEGKDKKTWKEILFGDFISKKPKDGKEKPKKPKKSEAEKLKNSREDAKKEAKKVAGILYDAFKKSHGLLT